MEIRSTGADIKAFQDWLGVDLTVVDQGDGDLGDRLTRAAMSPPLMLLGADTPDLSYSYLRQAADALQSSEAVIGPAEDGGYWLLGIARPMPFLFTDMPWSTERVAELTIARLRARGIEPAIMDTLSDLDRPDDLVHWPELLA